MIGEMEPNKGPEPTSQAPGRPYGSDVHLTNIREEPHQEKTQTFPAFTLRGVSTSGL